MKNKILSLGLSIVLLVGSFAGCNALDTSQSNDSFMSTTSNEELLESSDDEQSSASSSDDEQNSIFFALFGREGRITTGRYKT